MTFGEIVAPSIKDLFIKRIIAVILSGELKPGDKLPTERELADDMKIGKTTVHEGIRELIRLGFLKVTSRKGIYVADYAQTGHIDTFIAIMRYQGTGLDIEMKQSLYEIWKQLGISSFEKLAKNHTPADICILEDLQEQTKKASPDNMDVFLELIFSYPRTVARLTGNSLMPLIFNALLYPSRHLWQSYIQKTGKKHCLLMQSRLTEYIKNGDSEKLTYVLEQELAECTDIL